MDGLQRLRPGMFAAVQMHYRASNPGIPISGDSLLNMARGQFVPVVENNVIQMRPVRVGRDLGTQVYIAAGYATNLAVIEQETYLAQAQTTEVMAKEAWLKAAAQLDRVLGQTLEKSGISLKADQGEVGQLQR